MFLLDEVKNIDAYTQTKNDPQEITDKYKKRLLVLTNYIISYCKKMAICFVMSRSYTTLQSFCVVTGPRKRG